MSSPTPPLRPTAAAAAAGGGYPVHGRRRHGRAPGLRRPRVRRCKMKLMHLLMDREEEQRSKRLELEFEVSELETALDKEQRLGRVLQCSLQGRVVCHCCLSALVPTKVRSLLGELAMVEEEIFYLEKKVDDLRLRLHRERRWNDDRCGAVQPPQPRNWPHHQDRQQPRHSSTCGLGCRRELKAPEQLPCPATDVDALECESKASVGSASAKGEEVEHARRSSHCCRSSETPPLLPAPGERTKAAAACAVTSANKLSEELVRLTVTIFHKLNKTGAAAAEMEPKLNISCIGSRSLVPKAGVAAAMSPRKSRSSCRTTPTTTPKEAEAAAAGGGCHRRFVEFTRGSVDVGRSSLCLVDIKNLRGLVQKLSAVDPSFLTNKQKLAFWINIYNFCVMHAFLQHGLPPSPDKLLALLNQASVNVGGAVLDVLSIEHLILRHSPDGKQGIVDDDGGIRDLLLRSYGLGFPEPNVIFALCRGSRSSPALRVYTAEDVSSELERAKVEYLESSVRVLGRRQRAVAVPRLLHWHMRDFADDAASLLEWVHSQLPRGALKRAIREVLGAANGRAPPKVAVEVEPYDAEFCYLLPVL